MSKDLPKVTQGGRGRAGLEVRLCESQGSLGPRHPGYVPSLSLAGHGSLNRHCLIQGGSCPFVLPRTGARQEISHH